MKIRGNTVGTPLSIEKIMDEVTLCVEINTFHLYSKHSAEDIVNVIKRGGSVFAVDTAGSYIEPLILSGIRHEFTPNGEDDRYFATFKTAAKTDGSWWEFTVDDDQDVTEKKVSYAEKTDLENLRNQLEQKILIVTVDELSFANYNSRDIYHEAQNGCAFYLKVGESLIPLTFAMESEATFSRALPTGEIETHFVYDDGVYECVIEQNQHNPLVVEISDIRETASHSATEILRYLGDKGYVIGMDHNGLVTFAGYNLDSELAIFKTSTDANGVWKEYTIDDNKAVTVKEMSLTSSGQIGDIETALDSIIAIQNQLIGGDA